MADSIPFLSLDQRVTYLRDRGYIDENGISPETREYLARVNFHYFLGYARNFRMLRSSGRIDGTVPLDRVVSMIELDQEVAALVFRGFQMLEWHLRARLVEEHCALFPSTKCFLEEEHYSATSYDDRPTHSVVRDQILRMREPYILKMFQGDSAGGTQGAPVAIEKIPRENQQKVLDQLPIWSVVDGWSFGLLVRSILGTKPASIDGEDVFLWKRIAASLGTANTQVHVQLQSLIVLRNQVAHHSRLWMKTATNSPKMPKKYAQESRSCDSKSVYVVFMTLCLLLEKLPNGSEFKTQLLSLIASDHIYEQGIKKPLRS